MSIRTLKSIVKLQSQALSRLYVQEVILKFEAPLKTDGDHRRKNMRDRTVKIITAGRTDIKDLFERGDPFQWERLNHTPFLVFVEEGDTIRVEIVNSKKKLLEYSDETKVMVQWRGEFSSDFFQFTVGDYRPYAPVEKPKPTQEELWLQAKNIIKWTGANGGFIYLSYELPDPEREGKFVQKGQSDKFYAKPMLKFFEEHKLPVVERKARNRQEVYEKLDMRR